MIHRLHSCSVGAAFVLLMLTFVSSMAFAQNVRVFDRTPIRFAAGQATGSAGVQVEDHGRMVEKLVILPEFEGPVRVYANLLIEPVPKDELSVHDKWDRAGNVRLSRTGLPDLELVKFVTAYGGRTEHRVDVSHMISWLAGPTTFRAFIDTWVDPAWQVTLSLEFEFDSAFVAPTWVRSLVFEPSYSFEAQADTGLDAHIQVPAGLDRVELQYLVSGHCTDGRGADEFVPKDNVISVDGRVVYRYRPWRDDCRDVRALNPYTKKWSDGTWSSDFSRSGWCPGDVVEPLELDLTDHLGSGAHTVNFTIENVRPKDADGHHGYWRISARLIGWSNLPPGTP